MNTTGARKPGRVCAICHKGGACATFLTVLMRWGIFNSQQGKTNCFAHPACIRKEQIRRGLK